MLKMRLDFLSVNSEITLTKHKYIPMLVHVCPQIIYDNLDNKFQEISQIKTTFTQNSYLVFHNTLS